MNKLSQLFNVDNFIVSQVNPHLVPFLWHSIVAPIPGFDKMIRFLSNEFHLYLTSIVVNLREFGILKGMSPLNAILTQVWCFKIEFDHLSNPMIQSYDPMHCLNCTAIHWGRDHCP